MGTNDKKEQNGVAKLRERFYEIRRKLRPSPELLEAINQKKPITEKDALQKDKKKIASTKPSEDLDL